MHKIFLIFIVIFMSSYLVGCSKSDCKPIEGGLKLEREFDSNGGSISIINNGGDFKEEGASNNYEDTLGVQINPYSVYLIPESILVGSNLVYDDFAERSEDEEIRNSIIKLLKKEFKDSTEICDLQSDLIVGCQMLIFIEPIGENFHSVTFSPAGSPGLIDSGVKTFVVYIYHRMVDHDLCYQLEEVK
jgi:hypothetical protein